MGWTKCICTVCFSGSYIAELFCFYLKWVGRCFHPMLVVTELYQMNFTTEEPHFWCLQPGAAASKLAHRMGALGHTQMRALLNCWEHDPDQGRGDHGNTLRVCVCVSECASHWKHALRADLLKELITGEKAALSTPPCGLTETVWHLWSDGNILYSSLSEYTVRIDLMTQPSQWSYISLMSLSDDEKYGDRPQLISIF